MTHRSLVFGGLVVALGACADHPTGVDDPGTGPDRSRTIRDDVVGVSLAIPAEWTVGHDPALFEKAYGFMIYGEDRDPSSDHPHDRAPVARVALAYDASPDQLEELVRVKLRRYEGFPTLERSEIRLDNGLAGTVITGLPGVMPYSIVYVPSGDRVYEIGLWSEAGGITPQGKQLLNRLDFHPPTRSIRSLNLKTAEEALYTEAPPEVAARNARAAAERKTMVMKAIENGANLPMEPHLLPPPVRLQGSPAGSSVSASASASCGFLAPYGFYWQLQWDWTNDFYSGAWYSMRSESGWSAMSGNYGSYWGENAHNGLCYANSLNQYYANDWPAYFWDNAYAAFSGYVEWHWWGEDGYLPLGRYVVVENNGYRSLTAHLSGVSSDLYWGKYINGYYTVIGWAGNSGYQYDTESDWYAPHLHARVSYGESTYNTGGQPWGGESVMPRAFRCFACTDPDEYASGGGGWYTYPYFYHGRWMKY